MGVAHRLIKLAIMFVKLVRYKVIVGDDLVGPILPERGLQLPGEGGGSALSILIYLMCRWTLLDDSKAGEDGKNP